VALNLVLLGTGHLVSNRTLLMDVFNLVTVLKVVANFELSILKIFVGYLM
jgi:hypothetical protein